MGARIGRVVDLALGVLGAAVFAEPTVTKVEEVVGLVHGACQVTGAGYQVPALTAII